MSDKLIEPDANDTEATVLEWEELCSFVMKKTNQAGIWIALCRKTRKACRLSGGRSQRKDVSWFVEAIAPASRAGHCSTDFCKVSQAVIAEEQHTAVGKETGQTAYVERCNNTLRPRLARFVRKTLSFSKSLLMHHACLNLFLHRYNLERAIILM